MALRRSATNWRIAQRGLVTFPKPFSSYVGFETWQLCSETWPSDYLIILTLPATDRAPPARLQSLGMKGAQSRCFKTAAVGCVVNGALIHSARLRGTSPPPQQNGGRQGRWSTPPSRVRNRGLEYVSHEAKVTPPAGRGTKDPIAKSWSPAVCGALPDNTKLAD